MSKTCPEDNTASVDQSSFWTPNGLNWDTHRIGWVISGACASVTVLLSLISVLQHATHYTKRAEQRQILRILYMPPVYAVISFFSYRYFRSYTYYDLVETAYESITISAFLLLLIEYVATTASGHDVGNAIARKDKQSLPVPFCFWRYRPTKAYFMYTVKWSVLQYVVLRPLLSVVGIICQKLGVLCESGSWSLHTAKAYITVIDGVSITIALYGLLLFYGLTKDELKGRRPLAKFLAIKLIVMFTFYQSLILGALEGRVIHATEFWTEANIADGLNALAICIEMVFFSAFMMWAYTWKEYTVKGASRTSIWRPLWDSINYADFAREIWGSLKFFVNYARGKPSTRSSRLPTTTELDGKQRPKMDFGQAFGVYPVKPHGSSTGFSSSPGLGTTGGGESRKNGGQRASYDEDIRLAPYSYGDRGVTGAGVGVPKGHLGVDWHDDDDSPTSSTASASSGKRLVSPSYPNSGAGREQRDSEYYGRSQARTSVSASAMSEDGYSGIGQAV